MPTHATETAKGWKSNKAAMPNTKAKGVEDLNMAIRLRHLFSYFIVPAT